MINIRFRTDIILRWAVLLSHSPLELRLSTLSVETIGRERLVNITYLENSVSSLKVG